MSFLNKYPYTDFHELNLDFVLDRIHKLGVDMDEFKALNTITFSGVWNITQQYPAWTVVNDNNLGYISIRPVPAGITISNTDYWANIVDYSAELAGIHSDIDDLQNDIAAIDAKLAPGKWLFVGDSYQAWAHWYEIVIANLGLVNDNTAFYIGDSGHGFSYPGGEWENDFTAFCTGRTDLSEFKHIVIVGGLNDCYSASLASDAAVLRAAIASFFATAKANMANAEISVAFVGRGFEDVLTGRSTSNKMVNQALSVYYEDVTANGGKMLTNCEYSLCSYSMFAADGMHPNTSGGRRIAKSVSQALLEGSAHVMEFVSQDGSVNLQDTTYLKVSHGVYSVVDNNVSKCVMCDIYGACDADFTIDGTWKKIAAIPTICMIRNSKPIVAHITDSDATASQLRVQVKIENAEIYVKSDELTAWNAYKTMTLTNGHLIDGSTWAFIEDTLETM